MIDGGGGAGATSLLIACNMCAACSSRFNFCLWHSQAIAPMQGCVSRLHYFEGITSVLHALYACHFHLRCCYELAASPHAMACLMVRQGWARAMLQHAWPLHMEEPICVSSGVELVTHQNAFIVALAASIHCCFSSCQLHTSLCWWRCWVPSPCQHSRVGCWLGHMPAVCTGCGTWNMCHRLCSAHMVLELRAAFGELRSVCICWCPSKVTSEWEMLGGGPHRKRFTQ